MTTLGNSPVKTNLHKHNDSVLLPCFTGNNIICFKDRREKKGRGRRRERERGRGKRGKRGRGKRGRRRGKTGRGKRGRGRGRMNDFSNRRTCKISST